MWSFARSGFQRNLDLGKTLFCCVGEVFDASLEESEPAYVTPSILPQEILLKFELPEVDKRTGRPKQQPARCRATFAAIQEQIDRSSAKGRDFYFDSRALSCNFNEANATKVLKQELKLHERLGLRELHLRLIPSGCRISNTFLDVLEPEKMEIDKAKEGIHKTAPAEVQSAPAEVQ